MKLICDEKNCTGCGACKYICPKKCIELKENCEGFLYPYIKSDACTACGLCKKVCPILNPVSKKQSQFYMCWNQDDNAIKNSSSGGAFSALAKVIFNKNGVVIGAYQSYNPNSVYHTIIESYEEIDKVRLSKYNQSDLKDCFIQIRNYMLNGIPVLFCGTACQIGGLLNYINLSKARNCHSLLYTVDVLCHGVTSQTVVNSFLACKENKYRKKISMYFFRVKTTKEGWKSGNSTRMKLIFEDGTEKISSPTTDTFFIGFNNNTFLRESCYNCKYCGQNRVSDFTIADYWGVPEDTVPKEQLLKGISIFTVNNERALNIICELKKYMFIKKIDSSIAIKNNRSFSEPNCRPKERDQFFQLLNVKPYDNIIKELFFKQYIYGKIKSIIGPNNVRRIKLLLKRRKSNEK